MEMQALTKNESESSIAEAPEKHVFTSSKRELPSHIVPWRRQAIRSWQSTGLQAVNTITHRHRGGPPEMQGMTPPVPHTHGVLHCLCCKSAHSGNDNNLAFPTPNKQICHVDNTETLQE